MTNEVAWWIFGFSMLGLAVLQLCGLIIFDLWDGFWRK